MMVVPEKVEMVSPSCLRGFSITKQVPPLKKLEMKELYYSKKYRNFVTQQLIDPFLPISDQKMRHFFLLLEVPTCTSIKVRLIHVARDLFKKVVAIQATCGLQHHDSQKLLLAISLWAPRGFW